MKSFLKKTFYFTIPILLVVTIYILTDPFKVLYNYNNYLCDYVMLDRGLVSTRVYLKNYKQWQFNSFIFGSSRSSAYTSSEWEKYLPKGSKAYSFGAWDETIYGILKKLQFIDSQQDTIDNALIIIDTDYSFGKGNSLEYEDYRVSKKSPLEFHLRYFSEYLKEIWLIPTSIDYGIFKKQHSYMRNFIGMQPGDLDSINNDWLPGSEKEILKDSVKYYREAKSIFYKRPEIEREQIQEIDMNQLNMLNQMKDIFTKHHTNVKIVIGPLYDEIKFNYHDLMILDSIFGVQNVYDYSGRNRITENKFNFANDVKHYRKRTANRILSEIYGDK